MSERPTPDERMRWIDIKLAEIADTTDSSYIDGCVAAVLDMLDGCVIVHPDDVPPVRMEDQLAIPSNHDAWIVGWNACRCHIFGGDQ